VHVGLMVFSQVGRLVSEDVVVQLLEHKCLPWESVS